jgi:hypothetical protein
MPSIGASQAHSLLQRVEWVPCWYSCLPATHLSSCAWCRQVYAKVNERPRKHKYGKIGFSQTARVLHPKNSDDFLTEAEEERTTYGRGGCTITPAG